MSQYRLFVDGPEITVAAAGTAVQASSSLIKTTSIFFQARQTNTGIIYIGGSNVSSTTYIAALKPGQGITLEPAEERGTTGEVNVFDYWADAGTSGDKFVVTYETARHIDQ